MRQVLAALAARWVSVTAKWRRAGIGAAALAMAALVGAGPADVARGLTWLQGQVQASGLVSSQPSAGAQLQATCETAATLVKLASGSPQIAALIGALQTQSSNGATEALACWQQLRQVLGQADNGAELAQRNVPGQGYGAYGGFATGNALDTGWALGAQLQALSPADKQTLLAWVAAIQQADGSFLTAGRPDLRATAMVLSAMRDEASRSATAAAIATKASTWLLKQKNPQGNWLGDAATTATVFEAVHPYTGTEPTVASSVENFLLAQQRPDGSWDGDARTTAVVLRALVLTGAEPQDPTQPASATVRGVVMMASNGMPAAGATVVISVSGAGAKTAITDALGQYVVRGIAPGSATASANLGAARSLPIDAVLQSGTVTIYSPTLYADGQTPAPSRIRGQVLVFGSNAPLSAADVQVGTAAASSGQDGKFELGVAAGSFVVTYAKSGFVTRTQQVIVANGSMVDVGAVSLRPTRTTSSLRGVVTDLSGQVVPGAAIAITNGPSVTAGANGAYAFDELSGFQFTLVASASGHLTRSFTVTLTEPADATQNLTLPSLSAGYLNIGALELSPGTAGLRRDVTAQATVSNPSGAGASASTTAIVVDAQGKRVATLIAVDAEGRPLPALNLAAGAQQRVRYRWNTSTYPMGRYTFTARLQVPGTTSKESPDGVIVGSTQSWLEVTGESSMFGSVTVNPPILRAGTGTPVKLSALIQNNGNTPLPAQNYNLSVVDTTSGVVTMTQSVSASEIASAGLKSLQFPDWTPAGAGDFRVELSAPSTPAKVTASLYIGDSGRATFSVDRPSVPTGNQTVRGTIKVTGGDPMTGTLADPLAPLVKQALTTAVRKSDELAYNHYVTNDPAVGKCFLCHVQSQAIVGGVRNLQHAPPLDPLKRTNLLNGITQSQYPDGSIRHHAAATEVNVSATLALWATTKWPDQQAVAATNARIVDFLVPRQGKGAEHGTWPIDNVATWWRTRMPVAALNLESLSSLKPTLAASPGLASKVIVPMSVPGILTGDLGLHPGSDGTLYISLWDTNHKLWSLSPAGVLTLWNSDLDFFNARPLPDGRVIAATRSGIYTVRPGEAAQLLNPTPAFDIQPYGDKFLVSPLYLGQPGVNSKVLLMDTAGTTSPFIDDALLADTPGPVAVQPDGALVVPAYFGPRLVRFNPDGTRRDIPLAEAVGAPAALVAYRDGHLVGTEEGLFFLNKDWVAERWLHGRTRAVAVMPDGRLIVNHVPPWDLSVTPRLYEVRDTPINLATTLENIEIAVNRVADFLSGPNGTYYDANDNIDVAFRLYGLHYARLHYAGTPRADTLQSLMEPLAQTLRARQRADGGWRWREGAGPDISDPLVTAIVGVALDKMNPSTASPEVRRTVEYLLAQQKPDGLWYSVHPNTPGLSDGLADTALLATSWVEILLPVMLERLAVFDTELNVTFPGNAVPSSPTPAPASAVTAGDGSTSYTWKLSGVTEAGREVSFDVMLNAMQPDEVRSVAQSANLVFRNSFVEGSVTAVVEVPKVAAGTSVVANAFTDKPVYNEAEQALFSVRASNLGTSPRDAFARFTVLDGNGRPVEILPMTPLNTVGAMSTATFSVAWPVAGTAAGSYVVRAEVLSSATVLYATSTASFTVSSSQPLATSARLSSDRASYTAAQTVQLNARVTNSAANAALDNVLAVTEVKSSAGQVVFARTESITQMPPATSRQFGYALPASALATGSYSATTKLLNATGETLAQGASSFAVLGADQTGVGLSGQLQISPVQVVIGGPVQFTVQVTNTSGTNLSNVPVSVRIIEPGSGALLATLAATVPDLPAGQTRSTLVNWAATGADGQLLVASATTSVNGREVALAQGSFRPMGVPQLRVDPPQLTFTPVVAGDTSTRTVTVASVGTALAGTLTFTIGGPQAAQFAVPQGGCAGLASLPVGATCTLTVSYRPQTTGMHAGELRIGFAGAEPVVIGLSGRANATALTGALSISPAEVPTGQSVSLGYTVSNPAQVTTTTGLRLAVRNPVGDEIAGWPLQFSVGPNATYAGNQTYSVGTQQQTLTAVLSQVEGTVTTVLATASFSVVAAPVVVKVGLAAQIKREARILMLASCSESQDSHKAHGERNEREEHDDDDDEKRERRAESCTPQPDAPSCLTSRTKAASDLFQSLGVPHKIVTTESAFKHEMRCGGYNTYWVSGGAAKLDHWLVKEVREAVWGGDSLIMDGEHDDRNLLLHPVAGVKYRGKLGRSNLTASIPAGSLFAQGSLPTQGQPAKFELLDGQKQASFAGSYSATPAIISNTYGNGRSLLFAFDLVGMIAAGASAQVSQLVETTAGHTASGTAALTVGDTAAVAMSVTNQGTRTVSVQVQGDLPAAAKHVGASPEPDGVDNARATWSLILPGGSTQEILWRVRTTAVGTVTLPMTVHSVPEGTGTLALQAAAEAHLNVTAGSVLLEAVLPRVQALQPPTSSGRSSKNKAISAANDALALHNQGKFQDAIVQWTASANAVIAISGIDIKPARDVLAQALEASTDALCQGLACLSGSLTMPAQVSLWSNLNLSRAVTNSCTVPVRSLGLRLELVNRRTEERLLEQVDANLTVGANQTLQRTATWSVQSPAALSGDWLDTLLTASWQGHQIELARASTQAVPSQSVCQPGQALAANRFAPHGAAEGLFAQGGKEGSGGSDSWEWALGTNVQQSGRYEADHVEWVSGKTYQWQMQVNSSGQGSFTVKEGGRTVAAESFSGNNKLKLGNAFRLGIKGAGDVGTARIAASLTKLDGQPVSVSLVTDAAGQERSQAIFQPTLANGFNAEGTVKLTFTGKSPPTGAKLQMSVQAGTATCQ